MRLEPLAHVALLLGVLLACGGEPQKAQPQPSLIAICRKLVAAGVAASCEATEEPATIPTGARTLDFKPAHLAAPYKGTISLWPEESQATCGTSSIHMPPDDLPQVGTCYTPGRLTIFTYPDRAAPGTPADLSKWWACRKLRSPTECAKAQPAFYGAFKAIGDAFTKAVGAK